jgi:hypothetical protein
MPELLEPKSKVIHAAIGCKPEYVRVLDWEGKSLTFSRSPKRILVQNRSNSSKSFFPPTGIQPKEAILLPPSRKLEEKSASSGGY